MAFTIADLLGVGDVFEFAGTKYKLRRPTLLEQAKFSQWLKDKAKAEAARGDVPDEVRDGLYRAASRDAGELYYEVDSPGYVAALQRPAGFAQLLLIVLQTDHPEVTEGVVYEMLQAGLKEKFVQLVAAEQDDPKVLAAVLAILGFPPDYLSSNATSSSDSSTPRSESPSTP